MASEMIDNVIAAILAGGEGRRFRPYTDLIPKPMVPIGPEEKPLLEHIVKWISKYGIKKFVFLVGYRWRQISNYFGDGSRFGIEINYSLDDDKYNNTGGALLKAIKSGLIKNELVVVWYGDIIAPINIRELINYHIKLNADVTLALAEKYQVPVGIAKINNGGKIIELEEKPWINIKATIGILTINPKIVKEFEKILGTSFDIMGDLIPLLIKKGYNVRAFIYKGPWYDVGSLERYQKLPEELLREFLRD